MQQIAMKTLVFAVLLGTVLHDAAAVIHSTKYFYTGSSGVPNFPEFVAVWMVDDVQTIYYDSNIKRAVPKLDWVKKIKTENPQHWEGTTEIFMHNQQVFKVSIEIAKQLFNQIGGVHTYQWMYGCEWDDETNEVDTFDHCGYDGEDFIAFDLKTETFIAPVQQAVPTKYKWENDKAYIAQQKNYYTHICPEWLKKHVDYGWCSLMRTDLPSVFLLQKTPSSPVRCFASGFYPKRASLFWRKDGDDLHEDVEHGEILPNHDGTFQMSVDLKVSSVPPEDWRRYECVFQLFGVKDDIVTELNKTAIKTNNSTTEIRERPSNKTTIIPAVVVGALVLIAVGFAAGYMIKKKKKDSKPSTKLSADSVQGKDELKTVSGSLSRVPSTGSADSSIPLMDISGSSSSIPSTGSVDSSTLLINREATRNSSRTARTEDELCTVEVAELDQLEETQSVIQT